MTWARANKGIIISAVVGLLIGAGLGASGSSDTAHTVTEDHTATVAETLSADTRRQLRTLRRRVSARKATLRRLARQISGARATVAKNTIPGTGTFVVGQDIEPGTYRAAAKPGCYWARLNSLDTSDIADNDNADGPVVVEVLASDKAFNASDCSTFHKVN